MHEKNKHTDIGVGEERGGAGPKSIALNPQPALLVGLVHQLGLFFTHSSSSFKARATSVLFDQLLRHLNLLGKTAGHDEGILIQRAGGRVPQKDHPPNYHISLGAVTVKGMGSLFPAKTTAKGPPVRMDAALGQAFECLAAQGIDSMAITFPGNSPDEIDKLRLSLNVIARFRAAVENSATIVFRYFGRSIRVPVTYDSLGRPDPNLTLMASLNSLTAVNARELVKQAEAYRELALVDKSALPGDDKPYKSSYELIFKLPSLSSQIDKPLVEINTLPWVVEDDTKPSLNRRSSLPSDQTRLPMEENASGHKVDPRFAWRSFSVDRFREPITYQFLTGLLDVQDRNIAAAVDAILSDDFDSLEIQEAGQRLLMATRLLRKVESQCRDPLVIDRLIHHLQNQFLWVPETVLTKIMVQRKGIRLHDDRGALMVGMIHPRLLNMIAVVKSAVHTRQKIRTAENISFIFNYPNICMLADRFGIGASHALHLLGLLKGTISSTGRFNRSVFNVQADDMMRYGDILFEIYYCMLKQLPRSQDRQSLLGAFTQIISQLENPTRVLQFLLDGIFQPGSRIDLSDRNALLLANRVLCKADPLLFADMERTPEEFLSNQINLNQRAQRYAVWRLTADKVYMGIKLEKIQMAILQSLVATAEFKPVPTSLLLAMEREAIIFLSLIGGEAARSYLRRALLRYSDPQSELYDKHLNNPYFGPVMYHLRTIIQGISHLGNPKDKMSLKILKKNISRIDEQTKNAAYSQQVGPVMASIKAAEQTLQVNRNQPE